MKNEIHLHDGELNVMELLWSNKELAARDISKIIKELTNVLLFAKIPVLFAKQMLLRKKSRKQKLIFYWTNFMADHLLIL